jgi:MYXO-CTERM domain-containing protein
MTWTKRAPVADSSEMAWIGPIAYDEGRQELLFLGPQSSNSSTSFSEWDPVTAGFTQDITQAPLGAAASEYALAAAYDSIRRRMVVLTASPPDTWELDTVGLTWYHRPPASLPQDFYDATMVFDSARGVMVAFGESETTSNTVVNVIAEFKVSQFGNGEGCTTSTATSCASGFCVEGVCCDVAACTGQCMSCNVPGSAGTCALAKAGAEVSGSCTDGLACNAAGGCLAGNGRTCSTSSECASGFCVDGVCCESACTGKCLACNITGQAGQCRPYQEGTDPEAECGDGTGVCKSFCDGVAGCIYPANEVTCAFCMNCDGYGACTLYDDDCSYVGGNNTSATGGAGGTGGRPDTGGAGGGGGGGGAGGTGGKADGSAQSGTGGSGDTGGGRDAATVADASPTTRLVHPGCNCSVSEHSAGMSTLAFLAVLGLLPWRRHRRPDR